MVKFSFDWLKDALDDDEKEDYQKYIDNLNQVNQEDDKSND